MPLISVTTGEIIDSREIKKLVNTNDANLHKQLKMRAAEIGMSLGRLVDLYLRIGFILELENKENFEKIKNFMEIT